jgi:hypothetical protein
MAGDNLNVWYDPEGDHLEIVFDQKAGYFEDTSLENVMRKRDAEGNLLAISTSNLSSFAGTRPHRESTSLTEPRLGCSPPGRRQERREHHLQ